MTAYTVFSAMEDKSPMVDTVYRREIILEEANPMSGSCLASSKILTPPHPPPTARRVCTPFAFGAGEDTLPG